MKINEFLPSLLALITWHSRNKVDVKWSKDIWISNLFRLWELIFWRRYGIRADAYSFCDIDEHGKKTEYWIPVSFESKLAHLEWSIRKFFSTFKLPVFVFNPQFITNVRLPIPAGYMFAIALDVVDAPDGGVGTDLTHAHVGTGSNLACMIYLMGTANVTGVTYAGSSMTNVINAGTGVARNFPEAMYYLSGVTSGNQNVVVTKTVSGNRRVYVGTYTGVASGAADNSVDQVDHAAGTDLFTSSLTPVASNCWIASAFVVAGSGDLTDGTNGIVRSTVSGSGRCYADTNGAVNGATVCHVTDSVSEQWSAFAVSFAPIATTITVTPSKLLLMGMGM